MIFAPSPNFGPRKNGAIPSLVVIHYTAMTCAEAAVKTLCNPKTEVSAHYLINETGRITQLVEEQNRAWHAGAGQWGEIRDVNSHSIGIELANTGDQPFSHPQMDALCELLHQVKTRHHIAPQNIIAHSDLAPGRKIDPGARFDWRRLALENLSIWPKGDCSPPHQSTFQTLIKRLGYTAPASDKTLLHSFRLRFRPQIAAHHKDKPLDQTDMALLAELARDFPVDAPRFEA